MSQDISDISFDRSTLDPNYPTESSLASCGENVEQRCEEVQPSQQCYQADCRNVGRPSLTKECREVFDEECEVILEPGTQQQCTQVVETQYEEVCSTVTEQECRTVQQKVCQNVEQPPPIDGYGVPLVTRHCRQSA